MGETVAYIPAPSGKGSEYVELARSKQGRVFKKHILSKGELIHPKTRQKIQIDDTFIETLKSNFTAGICDIVQVPLANARNEHTEDPRDNIGEVIGIESDGDKVYALIDARDEDAAGKLGKTMLGASAFLSTNYTNNKTDKKVGPTLLHVAVTNRPYVTGLDDYEELVAASADTYDDIVVLSAVEDVPMTKDELIAELKNSYGVDVAGMEVRLSAVSADENLVQRLGAALAKGDFISLSAGEAFSTESVLSGVTKLAEENVELSSQLETVSAENSELQIAVEEQMKLSAAAEVDDLVSQGRVLPAQRDVFVEIKLSNPEQFDKLVPENAIVALSQEDGTNQSDENGKQSELDIEAEIARLSAVNE
jgi:hypothetical protein